MYEGMVEDINMLLNTGDIPNLYGMDEKVEILDKMQAAVRDCVSLTSFTNIAELMYLNGYGRSARIEPKLWYKQSCSCIFYLFIRNSLQ